MLVVVARAWVGGPGVALGRGGNLRNPTVSTVLHLGCQRETVFGSAVISVQYSYCTVVRLLEYSNDKPVYAGRIETHPDTQTFVC